MAIKRVDDYYVISSHRVWRPGVFADERAARYALTWCSDEDINALMYRHRNEQGIIEDALTFEELRRYRREQAAADPPS